ncbi:MAG TPA: glycerol-3-phosphate 1-O-acyltransferase PlsY [Candidatus Dormibacteraeota bacterium]|nr:glycerol-3-phosphate 1-O-acyltransferase PlsY [Candidatus Dormibacteraeota bacterium]
MSELHTYITLLAIPVYAYILGSIPFGVILTKALGKGDVRKVGSGNIGATNVARVAGLAAGVFTLLLDVAKGAGAVSLAEQLSNDSATWMMIAGLAALIGHCFPVWLNFKGGKGVATAAGAFLVLSPLACLGALLLFLLVVIFWRYVSLGSVSAAAAMPLLIYFLWAPRHAPPLAVTIGALAGALLIIYKHRGNLRRLIEGREPKFSFSKNKDTE